jgi:hypothetical protein
MKNFFGDEFVYEKTSDSFFTALYKCDVEKIIYDLNILLQMIPYDDYESARRQHEKLIIKDYNTINFGEWLYRTAILSFLKGMRINTNVEVHGSLGRSDIVIVYQKRHWVLELKVFHSSEDDKVIAQQAIQQIYDKRYANRYPNPVLLGLAINDKVRQITAFAADCLNDFPCEQDTEEDSGPRFRP